MCLYTTPASPPAMKEVLEVALVSRKEPPLKKEPQVTDFMVVIPLAASISSVIMEPPVFPTWIPRLFKKLSIFWLIFKKATAHRNQMNRLPVAASFPTASISISVTANTVLEWERSRGSAGRMSRIFFFN